MADVVYSFFNNTVNNFVNTNKFAIALYIKMVTIKEIRETFKEILQEHETKQTWNQTWNQTKHKKLVLDLISGYQALLKERLDQQFDSLTSVKTDVEDFKESPSFTQKHIEQKFLNKNEKVQNLEKEHKSSIKEDVGVIQTTEPTRESEICRKLMDLEDR